MQHYTFSIAQLAQAVNNWCAEHAVEPMHNRVGSKVTVRNIRYYQGLGLVDRPSNPNGRGFSEKHRLQLIVLRLCQARGLPLERIQEVLHGRTDAELHVLLDHGMPEEQPAARPALSLNSGKWRVVPLNEGALLVVRSGWEVDKRLLDSIRQSASPAREAAEPAEAESVNPPSPVEEDRTLLEVFRPEID